ncbi:hypothetical protein DL93DRAFT_154334 [Clavulina sp. PMI_390]|nr:hypothetical protein DL93DRAFT_154334 [Clavulina sp. PMI_390]
MAVLTCNGSRHSNILPNNTRELRSLREPVFPSIGKKSKWANDDKIWGENECGLYATYAEGGELNLNAVGVAERGKQPNTLFHLLDLDASIHGTSFLGSRQCALLVPEAKFSKGIVRPINRYHPRSFSLYQSWSKVCLRRLLTNSSGDFLELHPVCRTQSAFYVSFKKRNNSAQWVHLAYLEHRHFLLPSSVI